MTALATLAKKTITKANKIAIFGHENVDGDCVWCMLWLGTILEKLGKTVTYHTTKPVGSWLHFVPWYKKIKTTFSYSKSYDLLIFVDFTEYSRIRDLTINHKEYFDTMPLLIIDHHIGPAPKKDCIMLKDTTTISCAELIFEYAQQRWPKLIDAQVATYLYLWLTTDSGNFIYETDSERAFKNALWLVQKGADKRFVINNIFYNDSLKGLEFMQTTIQRIKLKHNILYTYFTEDECNKLDIDIETADQWFYASTRVKWPKLFVRFRIEKLYIKWSLRTRNMSWTNKKVIDCAAIARDLFGGGGHKPAAWFKVDLDKKKSIESQLESIINTIHSYLTK